MVVRVEQDNGKHINFYEGNHIGFHPEWEPDGDNTKEPRLFGIVIEGPKDSITVNFEYDNGTKIFLMNDQGKTISSRYI